MRAPVIFVFSLALLWLAAPASAEVLHYSRCELNEGKSLDDVQAWVNDWRALKTKDGIDYRLRVLIAHADATVSANEFALEGASSTLQSYAAAWDWWYTDPDAAKSNDQLLAAASCDAGIVYRSLD